MLHEALTGEVDSVTRCELLGALSGALALNGEEDASRAASDEAIALAATLRQPRLFVDAIHNRLYATVLPENVEDQLELSVQALAVAMEQGDELAELRCSAR